MGGTPDVIVVGAGIIGCAITHQLARRGARVRMFEARAVGAGATQAAAGVLAPYIEAPKPGPLLDLAVRSLAEYDRFIADVQEDSQVDVEYRVCGTLEVALDRESADRLRSQSEGLWKDYPSRAEWIDPSDARVLEPGLPAAMQGALLIRAHGYVVASQLAEALTWAALRHGAEVETGRRIAAIRQTDGRLQVVADDGAAWAADHVIVAAGSWTSQVGLTEPAARAVRPVRGQLLHLAWKGPAPRHVIWGRDCYAVPWKDGSVLVGATVEDVGFDERTTAAGVRDLLDAVCELLPAAWGATFREARVGLRPASSDGLPLLGPSASMPGLVYATGHYRNGILLAPITANLIADCVLGAADPMLQFFQPDRFASKHQSP